MVTTFSRLDIHRFVVDTIKHDTIKHIESSKLLILFYINMFGSRSGSPYGAFGLVNAPNASTGQGGPLNATSGIQMPSGGAPNPGMFSVYNRGIDNEVNTVPSCFVIPSSHSELVDDGENAMSEGDFVFVLRHTSYAQKYETRQSRQGASELSIVTLPKLNQLLRTAAANNTGAVNNTGATDQWYQTPESVAEWAVPFGVVLNSMPLNRWSNGHTTGNRATKQSCVGHNIVVSRKANTKHNFFSVCGDNAGSRGCQSMQHLAVQYSVEHATTHSDNNPKEVVQVSMLLVDDYNKVKGCEHRSAEWQDACSIKSKGSAHTTQSDQDLYGAITIDATVASRPVPTEASHAIFGDRPLGDPSTRFIVPIGRVLHSAPRCPSASECLLANHIKSKYDGLKKIEIELGCP